MKKRAATAQLLPTTASLIGHDQQMALLRRAHENGRLVHALLFAGPEHVGKMTAARELAIMLLGTTELERHPDFMVVERERDVKTNKLHGTIVLEQIHNLCGTLATSAFMNGWKVAVLDGADTLTTEAANALLKTLEEPHQRTMMMLLAPSVESVTATLRSRCQVFRFDRVPTATIASALKNRGIPAEQAMLCSGLADGRPGLAISYAEQPKTLTALRERREALLAMHAQPLIDRFAAADKLIPAKAPFQETVDRARELIELTSTLLRDALLLAHSQDRLIHADVRESTAAWAASAGTPKLLMALESATLALQMLDENVAPRPVLEDFFARL